MQSEYQNLEIAKILSEFDSLEKAFIDSSSLIYLQKMGVLNILAKRIVLYSLEEMQDETGFENLPVTIVTCSKHPDISNDLRLFSCSQDFRYPIISDDKQILMKARQKGLSYFNSLMMLVFLYYKSEISDLEYEVCLTKLMGIARYSANIYQVGLKVFESIKKEK